MAGQINDDERYDAWEEFFRTLMKDEQRVIRMRRARRALWRRAKMAGFLDSVFERVSRVLPLCVENKRNHWSKLVAQIFYVECACCLTWRMFFVGAVFGVAFSGLTLAAVSAILFLG